MTDPIIGGEAATLKYSDGEFHILKPGSFVLCAVTGRRIHVRALKYWSVERQEAYVDAETSYKRELEARKDS